MSTSKHSLRTQMYFWLSITSPKSTYYRQNKVTAGNTSTFAGYSKHKSNLNRQITKIFKITFRSLTFSLNEDFCQSCPVHFHSLLCYFQHPQSNKKTSHRNYSVVISDTSTQSDCGTPVLAILRHPQLSVDRYP